MKAALINLPLTHLGSGEDTCTFSFKWRCGDWCLADFANKVLPSPFDPPQCNCDDEVLAQEQASGVVTQSPALEEGMRTVRAVDCTVTRPALYWRHQPGEMSLRHRYHTEWDSVEPVTLVWHWVWWNRRGRQEWRQRPGYRPSVHCCDRLGGSIFTCLLRKHKRKTETGKVERNDDY